MVITVLLIKAHRWTRWTRWTSLQLEVLATACAAVFVMLDAGAPEATLGQHTSPCRRPWNPWVHRLAEERKVQRRVPNCTTTGDGGKEMKILGRR